MPSNTVPAVVQRFLNSNHRKEFMEANPWMSLQVAAVVFYRRHTSYKLAYATWRDIDSLENPSDYWATLYDQSQSKWWKIPVSQLQCTSIRPETLEKYGQIIDKLM